VRSKHKVGIWGLVAVTLMLATPAPAGAQRAAGVVGGTGTATFEGSTIDLAVDWGDARACLIWRQGGVVECFRTEAELDAREEELRGAQSSQAAEAPTAARSYSWYCSSSLRLYEHNWYGGRRLSFWDRGYWQNLADYGFEDQTSSYIVGACYVHLAEHAWGGGWWYPGPTYPYAGEPVMGWQDVISSIFIE
jgi:hypothetical protein